MDRDKFADLNLARRRTLQVMVVHKVAAVTVAGVAGVALAGSAQPTTGAAGRVCGPGLCIPGARGWSGSVGSGVVEGKPAAWLLSANFRLPRNAAKHEGTPSVPPGKILISVGDWPVTSASAHWPRVQRLRLPRKDPGRRSMAWHVRFGGRGVLLEVHFGSVPSRDVRQMADARLSAIRSRH
jgi:hypothetical protein